MEKVKNEDEKVFNTENENVLPVKKGDLKKTIKKGNKIAIDGHVFKVVNVDYFTGSIVMKYLPNENVFFKMPETTKEIEVKPELLTNEEKDVDTEKKES